MRAPSSTRECFSVRYIRGIGLLAARRTHDTNEAPLLAGSGGDPARRERERHCSQGEGETLRPFNSPVHAHSGSRSSSRPMLHVRDEAPAAGEAGTRRPRHPQREGGPIPQQPLDTSRTAARERRPPACLVSSCPLAAPACPMYCPACALYRLLSLRVALSKLLGGAGSG